MEKGPLPSLPKIAALRDSFGDNKPPDITRKITACVACRKQKVKRDPGIRTQTHCRALSRQQDSR